MSRVVLYDGQSMTCNVCRVVSCRVVGLSCWRSGESLIWWRGNAREAVGGVITYMELDTQAHCTPEVKAWGVHDQTNEESGSPVLPSCSTRDTQEHGHQGDSCVATVLASSRGNPARRMRCCIAGRPQAIVVCLRTGRGQVLTRSQQVDKM